MNLIQQLEQEEISRLKSDKTLPKSGMQVSVSYFVPGTNRIQIFTGICIQSRKRGISSSFKVYRKIGNEYVIRTVPLYSPMVEKITILKESIVRRKNLNYLIGLSAKKGRLKTKY